jgi:hypothetical protein
MIIIEYKLALHSKSKIDQNYASITSGSCFCSKLSNLKLENFLWSLLITTEGTSPISSSRLSTLSTLILSVSFSSLEYYIIFIKYELFLLASKEVPECELQRSEKLSSGCFSGGKEVVENGSELSRKPLSEIRC